MNKLIVSYLVIFWTGISLGFSQNADSAYKARLSLFLNEADSMRNEVTSPILPEEYKINLSIRRLTAERYITTILADNLKILQFTDEVVDHPVFYTFDAYDDQNRIVYISEVREHGFYSLFGISLATGETYTVYETTLLGGDQYIYEWKFSPDMRYLLKAGDFSYINDSGLVNCYGWSIMDLSNFKTEIHEVEPYKSYVTDLQWINNEQFKFNLTEIPYKDDFKYKEDNNTYYSILNHDSISKEDFSLDYVPVKDYTMDLKGQTISVKLIKTPF